MPWVASIGCWIRTRPYVGRDARSDGCFSRRGCEGLGADILARQHPDGSWRKDGAPVWLTTLFTMQMLRASGLDPADLAIEAAVVCLESGLRWSDQGGCWDLRAPETGGNTFFEGEVEPCINGGALAVGAYFSHPVETLARRLAAEQLENGGWNCEAPNSTRSSFHTTISVLEGCSNTSAVGLAPEITAVMQRGELYLLQRALYRRLSTGGSLPARSRIQTSSSSPSRLVTTTTSSALWTTSGPQGFSPMRVFPMQFASSRANDRPTAGGC